MQADSNMAVSKQTPGTGAVNRETPAGGGNSSVSANQQQQTDTQASITSLLKQDGVVISFNLDKDNNFVYKLVNPLTNEVIRQIPPEEFAGLVSSIQQTTGILVNKQV